MEKTIRERLRAIRGCNSLLKAWKAPNNKAHQSIQDCQNWLNSNFSNIEKEEMENGSYSNEPCHKEG